MTESQRQYQVDSKICSAVDQAKGILKDSKFPTSSEKLIKSKKKHRESLTFEAEKVVHAAYYLHKAIEQNKADEAAMRMFHLLVAYIRMTDLRDVPESAEWMKIGMDENEVYIKSYNAGLKNLLRNKNKQNTITPEKKLAIEKSAIELRKEYPDLFVYQIKAMLADKYKVGKSTIQQMRVIPKRTKKNQK